MRKCPGCRAKLHDKAVVCLQCGADLRPSPILLFLTFGSLLMVGVTVWMALGR